MPTLHEIATFDLVELTKPVDGIPAGARGGVLELREDGRAMVEITSPQLDAADRVIFVPLGQLRLAS